MNFQTLYVILLGVWFTHVFLNSVKLLAWLTLCC